MRSQSFFIFIINKKMFSLGIPNRQYRRATQVLGPESAEPIDYNPIKQDDGFYLFSFPEANEYDFRDIVRLLKNNGITTIGADNKLTERNIMKLTDLLKEQENPEENNVIDELQLLVDRWKEPTYMGGLESCEKSNQYMLDVVERIEELKTPLPSPGNDEQESQDQIALGVDDAKDFSPIQEQKLRKLIRKTIRE